MFKCPVFKESLLTLEFEESESLELSSLPEDDDDDDVDDELPLDELPDEEDALLEPARFGGIVKPSFWPCSNSN
jgi:hypothetical protein